MLPSGFLGFCRIGGGGSLRYWFKYCISNQYSWNFILHCLEDEWTAVTRDEARDGQFSQFFIFMYSFFLLFVLAGLAKCMYILNILYRKIEKKKIILVFFLTSRLYFFQVNRFYGRFVLVSPDKIQKREVPVVRSAQFEHTVLITGK